MVYDAYKRNHPNQYIYTLINKDPSKKIYSKKTQKFLKEKLRAMNDSISTQVIIIYTLCNYSGAYG
jgi:hypothetical protein